MRYFLIILVLIVFSCKKQHITNVRIVGNVKNIVTSQNISGIKLKLTKKPINKNRPISGNIVEYLETDVNGNFDISTDLSDKYEYKIEIADERYFEYTNSYWGIIANQNISNNVSFQEVEFKTAAKGNLRLNFILHTGSNIFEDTLNVSIHMPNGNPYFNPSIYVTDRVEYPSYWNIELMEGSQFSSFLFSKNGVDSIFSKTYIVEAGTFIVVDIDLW